VLLARMPQVQAEDLALSTPAGRSPAAALSDTSLETLEREAIRQALARHDGNVSLAAKALGLSRSALYRRLQRYGL
jgi:transcriptional regulator of acetoin/glycerol metabolism